MIQQLAAKQFGSTGAAIDIQILGQGPTAIAQDVNTTVLGDVAFGDGEWPWVSVQMSDNDGLSQEIRHFNNLSQNLGRQCTWVWVLKPGPTPLFDFRIRMRSESAIVRDVHWVVLKLTALP